MIDRQQLAAMGEHIREVEERKPEFKVPDGWKLVPLEATSDMSYAADRESGFPSDIYATFGDVWSAMLAAAPEYKQ